MALADADRRVTARALTALVDLPGADSSAMDGWAVCGEAPWTVVTTDAAGRSDTPKLSAHQAFPVVTGAWIPDGTTAILRSENARDDGPGGLNGAASANDIRFRAVLLPGA